MEEDRSRRSRGVGGCKWGVIKDLVTMKGSPPHFLWNRVFLVGGGFKMEERTFVRDYG